MWDIEYFEKANGRYPAKEYIDNLPPQDQIRVIRNLSLLSEFGKDARRPLVAPLHNHIYELRTKLLNRNSRILFFFFKEDRIILTHGIIKKSGKVSDSEIEKAVACRMDYLERHGEKP